MSTRNISSRPQGLFSKESNDTKVHHKLGVHDEGLATKKGHRERSLSQERSGNQKIRADPKAFSSDTKGINMTRKGEEKKQARDNFLEDFHRGGPSPSPSLNVSETKPAETTMNSGMRGTVPLYGIPSRTNEVQTEKGPKKNKMYGMSPAENDTLTTTPPSNNTSDFHKMYQVGDVAKGKVNAKELQAAFEVFQGKHFSDAACKFVVRLFDLDKAGGLDVKEFETLYSFVKQWVEAFNSYDADRCGFLSETEFDYALRKMDINFSKEFIKFLLTKNDPTNRKISLDQFILFCIQAQRFTEEFKARDQNYSGNINLRYEDFLELIMRCF